MKEEKNTKNDINTDKKIKNTKKRKIEKNADIEVVESKENAVKDKNEVKKKAMEKKNKNTSSFNLIEVIIIMIITAVFGVLIGSGVTYFKDNVVEDEIPKSLEEFLGVYDELSNEYYLDIDDEQLLEAGIKGMIDYLGDPYSSYLDYDTTNSLNEELEGEFVGMGASITVDENNKIYIAEIFKDSPAEQAGFKVGDYITAVNGTSTDGRNTVEVSYEVKGKEGTNVDITILRDNEEKVLTLTRGKVEIPSVFYHVVDNSNVGYIQISVFAKNTPKQFRMAMDELKSLGIDSIIIDVRDNYGGYLSSAQEIASFFLDKGDIIYQLDTKGKVEKIKNTNNKLYDMDVAVLMNGASASASEILASSLKENINAVLVGQKTFGKGTVQKAKTLSSGSMIKYTVQEWLTPNGNKVNLVGVSPDYQVILNEKYYNEPIADNDNQLQKAIEILKK